MSRLTEAQVTPGQQGMSALKQAAIEEYMAQIEGWEVVDVQEVPRLQRTYRFDDFVQALDFTNQVGVIAEEVDHHPVLELTWGRVTVSWWTHVIDGLHKNDFIMAARTDQIYAGYEED